jgi:hypothetical protein
VNAALPKLEAPRPLKWSKYIVTFDSTDQLKCAAAAGALPFLCSPTISNVLVTKTLIDGGAGLNVLSVGTFNTLQVPYDQLQPTKPFSGVTDGSTTPRGQIRLPVTFGDRSNYHTELIDCVGADIQLPYNAILGYPALAKFMAATHHGYNVLKMPGSGGIITVACNEKDAVCSLECAYQATAVESLDAEGFAYPPEAAPKKKKQQLTLGPQEVRTPGGPASGSAPTDGAPSPHT